MKNVWTILLVFASCSSFAQWPGFNRVQLNNGQSPPFDYNAQGGYQNVFQIDRPGTSVDGYLLFGQGVMRSPSETSQYSQAFAAKVNLDGDLNWSFPFISVNIDSSSQWINFRRGQGMIINHSGSIASILTVYHTAAQEPWNRSNSYLVELNHNAEALMQVKIQSDTTYTYGYSGLIEDITDSTYILYGSWQDSTMYFNNERPDAFLSKVDTLGNVIWERTYPNTWGVWHLKRALDGGYWIMAMEVIEGGCAFTTFGEVNENLVVIKTDALGNEESRLALGGPCGSEAATIIELSEDVVFMAGRFTFEEQNQNWDYHGYLYTTLVEQLDGNGALVEQPDQRKTYMPCEAIGYVADFHSFGDGYLIAGFNSSQEIFLNGGQQVGFLLHLDENRDNVWARYYSYYNTEFWPWGGARHWLWDSKITSDGGVVCCGEIEQGPLDPNPLLRTSWLFKTDSLGCIEPGCQFVHVEEITIGLEQSMTVYPNPANDRATVRFDLPADFSIPDHSQWVMIDLQGRELMRQDLSRSAIQSGDIPLDLSSIAPGIYQIHWILDSVWLDSVKVVVE